MALTLDEFNQCINDLYKHSQEMHDRWQLKDSSKGSYLTYSFIV